MTRMTGARMSGTRHTLLYALIGFLGAIAGTFIGRELVAPAPPVENELHSLLHERLSLDEAQHARLNAIEKAFAARRHELEQALRADNARIADAIKAEQGYGPRVQDAVDASHGAMGQLQKETLQHIFAMRAVLRPDQRKPFDAAVDKALTAQGK